MTAYLYSVVCEDRELVCDMAKFDFADVIPWGDAKDGYLFLSNMPPTELRWKSFGIPFLIEHTIKIERTQARQILGRNEGRYVYRHPYSGFPTPLRSNPEPALETVGAEEEPPAKGPLTQALESFLSGRG